MLIYPMVLKVMLSDPRCQQVSRKGSLTYKRQSFDVRCALKIDKVMRPYRDELDQLIVEGKGNDTAYSLYLERKDALYQGLLDEEIEKHEHRMKKLMAKKQML